MEDRLSDFDVLTSTAEAFLEEVNTYGAKVYRPVIVITAINTIHSEEDVVKITNELEKVLLKNGYTDELSSVISVRYLTRKRDCDLVFLLDRQASIAPIPTDPTSILRRLKTLKGYDECFTDIKDYIKVLEFSKHNKMQTAMKTPIKFSSLSSNLQKAIKREIALAESANAIQETLDSAKRGELPKNALLENLEDTLLGAKIALFKWVKGLADVKDKVKPDADNFVASEDLLSVICDNLDDIIMHAKAMKTTLTAYRQIDQEAFSKVKPRISWEGNDCLVLDSNEKVVKEFKWKDQGGKTKAYDAAKKYFDENYDKLNSATAIEHNSSSNEIEVIKAKTPRDLTVIHDGISDTIIVKPQDLTHIKEMTEGDLFHFNDGDNLNSSWLVSVIGDAINFKDPNGSTDVTVKRSELY